MKKHHRLLVPIVGMATVVLVSAITKDYEAIKPGLFFFAGWICCYVFSSEWVWGVEND